MALNGSPCCVMPWKDRLPILKIPEALNPFCGDGIDMFAAIAYHLPHESIKYITVRGLLEGAKKAGKLDGMKELVEATSGNTGVALTHLAMSEYGIPKVTLVVAPDIPDSKRMQLLLAGAKVIPPEEGLTAIATARKMGHRQGILNLNQYANRDGYMLHESWTGPRLGEGFEGHGGYVFGAVGTGGTLIGINNHFKVTNGLSSVSIIGVLCSQGEEIPGARDYARMKEIKLAWAGALKARVDAGKSASYLAATWLHRFMHITPGPTSGLAFVGGLKYLKTLKDKGKLECPATKRKRAIFIFADGSRSYDDRFAANVPFTDPKQVPKDLSEPLPWEKLWK